MAGLRITGGSLRGRRIPLPAHQLRPTSERARQAFFNIVGERIEGAAFLDLFAGSGIFSFEAISRGAVGAWAIESSRRAVDGIKRWSGELDLPIRAIEADVFAGIKRLPPEQPFDVVYADPPYDYPRHRELLETIDKRVSLVEGSLVAIEHRDQFTALENVKVHTLCRERTVTYGEVAITLFGKVSGAGCQVSGDPRDTPRT